MKTYLVTGAAGFIGTNFIKYLLQKYSDIFIVAFDKLTYAGKKENLEEEIQKEKIKFIQGDICDSTLVEEIFIKYSIDYVVNFAAESHVDRSIESSRVFLETNVMGTQNLLEIAKKFWMIGKDNYGYPFYQEGKKFLQVSTDEVYGSLEINTSKGKKIGKYRKIFGTKFFNEEMPLAPRSPYSASKAAADLLVMAYKETYHLPVNITRSSNNYGPYQFPEKLIPLMIQKILQGKNLPIYGNGKNVRDWIYVEDHCRGIELVLQHGKLGEIYNIGGLYEETNFNIVLLLLEKIVQIIKENQEYQKYLQKDISKINKELISYVQDRLGHDERYAMNISKIQEQLGWQPKIEFSVGLQKTILWYLQHQDWILK
ncbi:dTDP-glucose 4,6-dehydratase [Fusobacterium equinum]|uniref:dTDP-glucose 4,6-dehydratase n=1 Tax=Fusobacterium equinum TaxID=134605 RepID=A0A133NGZ3_9FUSO|nr:dTDP-glucose 4,6-dehydratase [Fusobacterium equinum]KXA15566.1 dTDP-glucose 4,6-dehydratase [Fusobacterium equinum]